MRSNILNEGKVKEIRKFREQDLSYKEIANIMNISKSTVNSVLNKRTWRNI